MCVTLELEIINNLHVIARVFNFNENPNNSKEMNNKVIDFSDKNVIYIPSD